MAWVGNIGSSHGGFFSMMVGLFPCAYLISIFGEYIGIVIWTGILSVWGISLIIAECSHYEEKKEIHPANMRVRTHEEYLEWLNK